MNFTCVGTTVVPVAPIVSGEPVRPVLVAVIDCAPIVAPSVHVVCTSPAPSLTPDTGELEPPPLWSAGAVF